MPQTYSIDVGGRTLTIETGKLAQQSDGAVVVRYGDVAVLATVVGSRSAREGIDFFPLTVDYEERHYAAGRIPGSFFRREGRPSTEAVLTARLIDRPMRPLFPKGYRNEVQIVVTVLSVDQENDPDMAAIVGASAALTISDIPFGGPVAAVRVGYIGDRYVINPTFAERDESDLDLVVAGTADAIMMVEAGAEQVGEAIVLEGLRRATAEIQRLVELQTRMQNEIGRTKREVALKTLDPAIRSDVVAFAGSELEGALRQAGSKQERDERTGALRERCLGHFAERYAASDISEAFEGELSRIVRAAILDPGVRPDGRDPKTIRPITSEVGLLPRVHGSGLFTRGETQVLAVATLGSKGDAQKLDTLEPVTSKRFMHHYNFPPFSTGETGRVGAPRRREIGHGALAERALEPSIPDEEDFPYTLRIVSDVLSSNGSTSMASVCASTLALMDAGVPILAPVAGVAMGLILGDGGTYQVLTDIAGMEDHLGDMDFKVAGTRNGITALQMDIKVKGITIEIMERAMAQAHEGRMFILGKMLETISAPRPEVSQYAPRMYRIQIDQAKIGAVIGPGGRVVRGIVEETGCSIDIEEDGSIFIGAANEEAARRAIAMIEGLTKEIEVGETYTGKVVRLMAFGAFVEILPGKDGLVHISELSTERVNSVEDVVNIGDEITVMVTEIDSLGRVNLSRRAVLEGETIEGVSSRRGSMGPPRGGPGGPGGGPGGRPFGGGGGPPRGGPPPRPRGDGPGGPPQSSMGRPRRRR